MEASEAKGTVRAIIESAYNHGDFDGMAGAVGPDYVCHNPAAPHPLDDTEVVSRIRKLRAAFPDLTARVEDLVAEGDRVAARVTMRGTHRGPFLGVPASNREIEVGWIEISRFENGALAETWYWLDTLGLLHQIGATTHVPAEPDALQPT